MSELGGEKEMKTKILPALFLPLLFIGCAPVTQSNRSTALPTSTMSLAEPTSTSGPLQLTPATTPPTHTPAPEPTVEAGRLGLAEAEELVRSWYEQQAGEFGASLEEEITPEGAWEQLVVQVFGSSMWPFSEAKSSYVVRGEEVWPVGFQIQGRSQSDVLLADLDLDGRSELVYAFDYSGAEARIGVFHLADGQGELLDMNWSYPGGLALRKGDDGRIRVMGRPEGSETSEALGALSLQGKILSLETDPNQGMMATYHSPTVGISFQYPAGWEEVEEGHYQGEDGFFQISPYESIASGSSDAYHRLSFRMVRACTWEANTIPGQYGQEPDVCLLSNVPGRAQCLISPGAGALQDSPALLLETPNEGWGLVQADARQMALIQRTLVYEQPGGRAQPGEDYPYSAVEIAPELDLQTSQIGELTLEEYSLFPASENTPLEGRLAGALPEVRERRDPWRAGPVPDYEPESLERDNAALAPFGYRLEGFTLENGEWRMRLYQGEVLIKDDLSLYPRSLVVEPIHQADFALIVEETGVGLWLIRRDSLEHWDIQAHLDSYDLAFAGGRLAAYEFDPTDRAGTLWVTLDGERVYALFMPWRPLHVSLNSWGDIWMLLVDGTMIVNGEIMNLAWGYGEIFNYQLLNGKPFFFYEKGGQVGISYDGQELPLGYNEVIHGECCGGDNNPRNSEHMAWFYTRREGTWYYVEIGKYG